MGVMAGETCEFPPLRVPVGFSPLDPLLVMAIEAEGIPDLSHQGFGLAFVDVMADDTIHDRRAVDEWKFCRDVLVTFQAHILGREDRPVYRTMTGGAVVFPIRGRMTIPGEFRGKGLFFRLVGLGGLRCGNPLLLSRFIGVGDPVEKETKDSIPGVLVAPV